MPFKIYKDWKYKGKRCLVIGISFKEPFQLHHFVGYTETTIPYGYVELEENCNVSVHGGVTFYGNLKIAGIDPKIIWYGFDCSHVGDHIFDGGCVSCDILTSSTGLKCHKWTVEEVAVETEKLAKQIIYWEKNKRYVANAI